MSNEEWKTIDTAPKDGTTVLVYPPHWGNATVSIAWWDDDKYANRPRPFWKRIDARQITDSRENPPTHWMPMPPPPEIPE